MSQKRKARSRCRSYESVMATCFPHRPGSKVLAMGIHPRDHFETERSSCSIFCSRVHRHASLCFTVTDRTAKFSATGGENG